MRNNRVTGIGSPSTPVSRQIPSVISASQQSVGTFDAKQNLAKNSNSSTHIHNPYTFGSMQPYTPSQSIQAHLQQFQSTRLQNTQAVQNERAPVRTPPVEIVNLARKAAELPLFSPFPVLLQNAGSGLAIAKKNPDLTREIDLIEKREIGGLLKRSLQCQTDSRKSEQKRRQIKPILDYLSRHPSSLEFPDDDLVKLGGLLTAILINLKNPQPSKFTQESIRKVNGFQCSLSMHIEYLSANENRLKQVLGKLSKATGKDITTSDDGICFRLLNLFFAYKNIHASNELKNSNKEYKQRYNHYELFLTLMESFVDIAETERLTWDSLIFHMENLTQILLGSYLKHLDECLKILMEKNKISVNLLFAYKYLFLNYAIKILAPYKPISIESQIPEWPDILRKLSSEPQYLPYKEQYLLYMIKHIKNKTSYHLEKIEKKPSCYSVAHNEQHSKYNADDQQYLEYNIITNIITTINNLLAVISPPPHSQQPPIA